METESIWQIIVGVASGVGTLIALAWSQRKKIGIYFSTLKTLLVAPMSILEKLAKQEERDEAAAKDRKAFEARLSKQDEVLAKLLVELTPNGGSSIKDMVKNTNELAIVSDARIRLLQAFSDVCIFECDAATGSCTWVNEGICKLFDLHPDQMLGWGWLQAIEPTERESVKRSWKESVEGKYPYSWEYTIVQQNGERVRVRAKAHELRDKTGKVLMYQGTIKPIEK